MVPSARQLLLVLVTFFILIGVEGNVIERGKIHFTQANDDYLCQQASFSKSFKKGTPVSVFASVNRGNGSSSVYDSIFVWVEEVSNVRFKACVVEGGRGAGDNFTIDWFAFQGPQTGAEHGATLFSKFTTGSQCNRVAFKNVFKTTPTVHVTPHHTKKGRKYDAMLVWIEKVSPSEFEVCLQESRVFDGLHEGLKVNWMAYEKYPSTWKGKESKSILFSAKELPSAQNKYALCKTIKYDEPFFKPPVVLATVYNAAKGNKSNDGCDNKDKEPLLTWMEEVTKTHFRICMKDHTAYGRQRSDVEIDYFVIGDLDPCRDINCTYESFCYAYTPWKYACICKDDCPSYEEQVCASNGRTFKNMCFLKKKICETRGNYTNYHPGSCRGFPMQKGRHEFQNTPSWAEDQCDVIKFKPFIFYPHMKIYVQLTVNHFNYSDDTLVHEATTPWVESINTTQFTACVTRAGRNDYPADSFALIDWVAYQGAPPGGIAGEEMFLTWWTGTSCRTVTFPNGKYSEPPSIFATAVHYRSSLMHDATSVWLEDVSTNSFKICLRELQNFAGVHDDISVNWLAFGKTPRPVFKESSVVSFPNSGLPSIKYNYAFCKDVTYSRSAYTYPPTVLVTSKHSTGGGNAAAECNGIVSWIESITTSGFRICVKELYVQRFDPLNVSYAVMGDSICDDDWNYFRGYCYRQVAACDSWGSSQGKCATQGANLPSIHSQEENVYVQSLHGGEHSWLGLTDINSEGKFVWSDGSTFKFKNWAKGQPNNYGNEDCVHTLGFLKNHHYEWNDVNCTDCHRFTCKKDYDECIDYNYHCPADSHCINSDGSYTCKCNKGFRLDANKDCEDMDECRLGTYTCHVKARCENIPGTYRCRCAPGLAGTGKTCGAPNATVISSCTNLTVWQSDSTGYIESNDAPVPGHVETYKSDMDCTWNITSNGHIELVFIRLKTEDKVDIVTVYDGVSRSSPLIGTLFGNTLPKQSLTSTSNNLYVRFTSDISKEFAGFRARYRAITDGSVRINSTSPSTGRVEVFYDGKWGTICDDAWDLNDAHVICRQLGFKQALQAYRSAYHGQGSGPIWLDDLACSGSEKNLHDCRHRGWGKHDCTHGRDASVKCTYGSSIIRLAGGSHNYGRVEVLVGGQWGTICDHTWDTNDAKVVCRQLGFKGATSAPRGAAYGQGSGPIQRSHVYCEGNEESLLDCPHCPSHHCWHSEDASVVCHN
nr:uncharacterized protein LOC131787615 [Pocillopora verrucosa]